MKKTESKALAKRRVVKWLQEVKAIDAAWKRWAKEVVKELAA